MQWYEATSKKLEAGHRYSHQELIKLLTNDYPQMRDSSYHWAVCGMLKSGSLTKIARNVYVVQNERKKPVYRPAYSDLAAKLISQVSDKYPSVHFTVFETALMNDFLNHLVAQNTVYIQIIFPKLSDYRLTYKNRYLSEYCWQIEVTRRKQLW